LNLKGIKAGRFSPKCPKCSRAFLLTVGDGPEPVMKAAPLPATAKPAAPPAPAGARQPAAAAEAATGEWQPPAPAPASAAAPTGERQPEKPAPAATPPAAQRAGPTPAPAAGATGERKPPVSTNPPEGPTAVAAPSAPAPPPSAVQPEATGPTAVAASEPDRPVKAARKTMAADERAELPRDAPTALGGYQILKRLGQGGMGTVYLARQLSLDRKVALKTMNKQWAENPRFLARFTREAYAAAQLVHHNVVQIYDIGEDKGIPYFSMEFVPGTNLGQIIHAQGKLDVEEAVGYVLQAARGLKFAHEQGMVHRDVKPDNLMLNDLGVVKVADLGLVKTPGAAAAEEGEPAAASQGVETTAVGMAMGTPAYMAPEQGTNAAGVDHRADIYSLGCTLYVLLTGRPPFQGKTAMEVITKHRSEPIVRPEVIVKRVPNEVSEILLKMLAKKPEERYADLSEVIRALEGFLGVQSTGPFSPREEHARALEDAVRDFSAAPAARLRSRAVPIFFAACAGLFLLSLLFGWAKVASCFLALALFTGLFAFVVSGFTNKSHLFSKTRALVFDSTWTDRLTWLAGLALVLVALWLFGLWKWWVLVVVLAAGLAGVYHVLVDRKLAAQRQPALDKTERLLKTLRLRGLEEDAVRQFVCKYGGQRWQEFFDTLFGYEALLLARKQWGETGGRRPYHFAAWRDPVVRWIEARQKARKEARERKLLEKVERKSLEAKGVSAAEAKEKARVAADDLVSEAAALKQEVTSYHRQADRTPPAPPRLRMARMLGSPTAAPAAPRRRRPRSAGDVFKTILSPKVRFLAGAALLAACFLWMHWNDLDEYLSSAVSGDWQQGVEAATRAEPLPVGPLAPLFNSIAPGVAGVLLILASFGSSLRFIIFCVAGALVSFFGPLVPVPADLPLHLGLYLWPLIGLSVAAVGLVLSLFEPA
jgi:hypothetical protein